MTINPTVTSRFVPATTNPGGVGFSPVFNPNDYLPYDIERYYSPILRAFKPLPDYYSGLKSSFDPILLMGFQDRPDQYGLRPGDCFNANRQKVPCGSSEDIGETISENEAALYKENEELKAKLEAEGFLGIPGALKRLGDFMAGAGLLIGAFGILILIVLILKR